MSLEQNPFRERLGLLVPINNLQARQQEQLLATAEILIPIGAVAVGMTLLGLVFHVIASGAG